MKKYLPFLVGILTYFLIGTILHLLNVDEATISRIQNMVMIILLVVFIILLAYIIRKRRTAGES